MIEYHIQGWYGTWETVTVEATRAEARQMLATYNENEPGVAHRIKRVRAS